MGRGLANQHAGGPSLRAPAGPEKDLVRRYEKYRLARATFLRKLGTFESQREPRVEFAEHLVAAFVGGKLAADRNQPGWDVVGPNGERIQVRTLSNHWGNYWKNDHTVDFRGDCDRYALVVFDVHQLHSLFIFPREGNRRIYDLLKKRHGHPDATLQVTQANAAAFESNPEPFEALGMVIHSYRRVDRQKIAVGRA